MESDRLEELARRLLDGRLPADVFLRQVVAGVTADLDEVQLDLDRRRRCGFPEVVFAQGKSVESLAKIFRTLLDEQTDVLATRVSAEQAEVLAAMFPAARYNPLGRTLIVAAEPSGKPAASQRVAAAAPAAATESPRAGRVVVVTAGTSDRPVAEEARETLLWMGIETTMIQDVGVAGPHRLPQHVGVLRRADAVVVVAGMEGALPSVVGGFVDSPVIAVPTSVGYGASLGGIAPLLTMLNSCAANVTVVNIDAGFKAGYVAGLIARKVAGRLD